MRYCGPFLNLTLALDIDLSGEWARSKSVSPRSGCEARCVDVVSAGNGLFGDAYEFEEIWVHLLRQHLEGHTISAVFQQLKADLCGA